MAATADNNKPIIKKKAHKNITAEFGFGTVKNNAMPVQAQLSANLSEEEKNANHWIIIWY